MSRPRSHDPKPPVEPDTASRRALLHWLGSLPAPRLAFLARASGIVEQTLWAFVERLARPEPDSEAARLLAIATRGAVPSFGWRTDEELEACRGARARAALMATTLDAAPQTPRSRAPASRPHAARRRRPHGPSTPRSARPASSRPLPSTAHVREAPLEAPRLTLLLGHHEPPPATPRSEPPTQPSSPIRPLPSQSAARASSVAVVETRGKEAQPSSGRRRDVASSPPAARGEMAVADAIATLTQQGYAIRIERKE
jgi:hypothetical protein